MSHWFGIISLITFVKNNLWTRKMTNSFTGKTGHQIEPGARVSILMQSWQRSFNVRLGDALILQNLEWCYNSRNCFNFGFDIHFNLIWNVKGWCWLIGALAVALRVGTLRHQDVRSWDLRLLGTKFRRDVKVTRVHLLMFKHRKWYDYLILFVTVSKFHDFDVRNRTATGLSSSATVSSSRTLPVPNPYSLTTCYKFEHRTIMYKLRNNFSENIKSTWSSEKSYVVRRG